MTKITLLLTVSLLLGAGWARGQTASFSFDDTVTNSTAGDLHDSNAAINAGTFSSGTGTFNLDINLTFAGGTSTGYSLWLETETGAAPNISITSETYFTFPTATDGEVKPWNFTDSAGTNAPAGSFKSDQSATQSGDLGATDT